MTRLSATDAAVQVMLDEGVEIVFGIPGGAILPLYQSIWKSGKISNYLVRHEQGERMPPMATPARPARSASCWGPRDRLEPI